MIARLVRSRLAIVASLAVLGTSCTGGNSDADSTDPDVVGGLSPIGAENETAAQAEIRASLAGMVESLYLPGTPNGQVVEVDLIAAETTIDLVPDAPTKVWAYNGSVPGPQIDVPLGDTVRLTLQNDLASPTSIHWHGIRVPEDMDGVPGLSQAAVAPGESFTYSFTPPDRGTYWYHSHTLGSEQLDRGLYGAIVVADPAEADLFDVDVVWTIDDWLLGDEGQIVEGFFDNHVAMHHGRRGELLTANGDPENTLRVPPGARVRLRLINASNGRWYDPDFEGLAASVIAVDGQLTSAPVALEDVTLAPGSRLDVVFDAPLTPGVHRVVDAAAGPPVTIATVVVEGDAASARGVPFEHAGVVPNWADAELLATDLELRFELGIDDDLFSRFRVNGRSYPDVEPVQLVQGRFTKIRMVNRTGLLHPIHLHGQFFKVLSRGGVPVDEPFFRETVLMESEEVIEIGIVPSDTGQWLLHCHIQEHADAGMATVAIVRPAGAPLPALRDLRAEHITAPLTEPEGDTSGEMQQLP